MKHLFLLLISFYQKIISPFLGTNCRYNPTCSQYTKDAIKQHGVIKGLLLGTKRVLSCHPYCCKEMHDPVPERFAWKEFFGYKKRSKKDVPVITE